MEQTLHVPVRVRERGCAVRSLVENRNAGALAREADICLTENCVRVGGPCVQEAAEDSADQVRVVADEEIAEEDVGMGDPEVEIVVAFAVDDFPAGIAVRMTGEGVDLDRDFF